MVKTAFSSLAMLLLRAQATCNSPYEVEAGKGPTWMAFWQLAAPSARQLSASEMHCRGDA